MKISIDIIGLPIIGIAEGKELGTVKNLLINPIDGTVTILIDDNKWYWGAKFLPLSVVTGVGEDAIIIENSDAILTMADAPEFEELIVADLKVIGTKVLTKNGRIQGKVTEIILDNTGKIIACKIEDTNGKTSSIETQRILTFGKDVLIICDEHEIAAKNYGANDIALSAEKEPVIPPVVSEVKNPIISVTLQHTPEVSANDDSTKKFAEKSRKDLLGKKAICRIETDNGLLIVEEGGKITEEVLQKAKLTGSFLKLSMNIQ